MTALSPFEDPRHAMPKVPASCRTHASEFAAAGSPTQTIPAAAHAVSQSAPGEETFQWGGCYGENPDQRTTDFTILGVLEGAPAPVPASVAGSPKLLLGNSHPAHQSALLDAMPSVDLCVADTMGLWIDVARPELESLLARVHGVVMNEEEAASFTGAPSLVDAAQQLLGLGPNFAVVKKGQHGCIRLARWPVPFFRLAVIGAEVRDQLAAATPSWAR